MISNEIEPKKKKKPKLVKNFLIKYFSVILGLILVLLTLHLWKSVETENLKQLSKDVEKASQIYANKVETRFRSIEFALNEIAVSSPPSSSTEKVDWDIQADFYINNFSGIDSIAYVDRDMIIRRVMSDSSSDIIVNTSLDGHAHDSCCISLLIPIYNENKINGFILVEVNVPKMILSFSSDFENDYMVKITKDGENIQTSENWMLYEKGISKKRGLVLDSVNTFEFTLSPTRNIYNSTLRNSYQILIYGMFLTFGMIAFVISSQVIRNKSNSLKKAQNELTSKNIKLEEQLRDQQRLQAIGILASGVAHEINNPLNGIMNYSQIIVDASEQTSEYFEYAKEIISETKRVSTLVHNLLQFSRQTKNHRSFASLNDIISRTTSLMNVVFKKDQIELQVRVSEDLPHISCHSQQIQQVLMNLLTNSRDALNDKYSGYNEDKRILLTCETIQKNNTEYVRLTVEDHGNGIPDDVQKRIFSQFFTTKEADKGTGIGLHISMQITKEHNGELTFETEEGNYTKFHLDLPIDNGSSAL